MTVMAYKNLPLGMTLGFSELILYYDNTHDQSVVHHNLALSLRHQQILVGCYEVRTQC